MGAPLKFDLSLTSSFEKALAPVIAGLGKTEAEMAGVRDAAQALDLQFSKTSAKLLALKTNPDGLRQLARAERELRDAQKSLVDEGGSLRSFFTFDVASAAASALGVVRDLGRSFVDLGIKIAQTVGEEQDYNLALKLTVGAVQGSQIRKFADDFANTTRFDDGLVKQQLLPMLDNGIKDKKLLDDIATAAADVSARQATGQAGFVAAMSTLSRLSVTGVVDNRSLMSVGVNSASYFRNLADLLGTTSEEARKRVTAGAVKSSSLLSVALDEIAKREGGALGKASLAAASTVGGTLQRLQDVAGNVFKKVADSPGMKKVQSSLDTFIAKMNGPIGDKLMSRVDMMLGKLADFINPEKIGQWLDRVVDAFDTIGSKIDTLVTASEAIGAVWAGSKIISGVAALSTALPVLGTAAGGLTAAMGTLYATMLPIAGTLGAIAAAAGSVAFAIKRISDTSKELGGGFFRDLKDWFTDKPAISHGNPWRAAADAAGRDVGTGIHEGVRDSLDIHSPSRRMAWLGQMAMEGFAVGLDAGSGRVRTASRDALSGIKVAANDDAAGGGRPASAINFAPVLNFHGVAGDEKQIADEAVRQIRVEFARLLDDVQAVA